MELRAGLTGGPVGARARRNAATDEAGAGVGAEEAKSGSAAVGEEGVVVSDIALNLIKELRSKVFGLQKDSTYCGKLSYANFRKLLFACSFGQKHQHNLLYGRMKGMC